MNSSKVEISKGDYCTMGAGAAVGAIGAKKIINTRINHFAKDAFDAFSKGGEELSTFVSNNSAKMQAAASSKKGFFGKINRILANMPEGASMKEKIKEASKVVEGYKVKAAKLLGTEASKEEISSLANRLHKEDIAKSVKSSSALKNAAKVAAAGALGVILFSAIKEVGVKLRSNSLLRKTESEINTEDEKKAAAKEELSKNTAKEAVESEEICKESSSDEAKVPVAKAKRITRA